MSVPANKTQITVKTQRECPDPQAWLPMLDFPSFLLVSSTSSNNTVVSVCSQPEVGRQNCGAPLCGLSSSKSGRLFEPVP